MLSLDLSSMGVGGGRQGHRILSELDPFEFYNQLLGKSHFTSRVADDLLSKDVTVTEATGSSSPWTRQLQNLISVVPPHPPPHRAQEQGEGEPHLFPPWHSRGMALQTHTTLSPTPACVQNMFNETLPGQRLPSTQNLQSSLRSRKAGKPGLPPLTPDPSHNHHSR